MSEKMSNEKSSAIKFVLAGIGLAAVGALVAFGFGAMLMVVGAFMAALGWADAFK